MLYCRHCDIHQNNLESRDNKAKIGQPAGGSFDVLFRTNFLQVDATIFPLWDVIVQARENVVLVLCHPDVRCSTG